MESSKDFGEGEECNSGTESGWTMYLCSPKHSDESDIYDDEYISKNYKHKVEDESDDSMASDASSGPIRLAHSWGNDGIGHGMFGKKVQADEKNVKCFSNKKAKHQKQEKERSVYTTKEAEVSVKCNGKVRKNSWFGKRK